MVSLVLFYPPADRFRISRRRVKHAHGLYSDFNVVDRRKVNVGLAMGVRVLDDGSNEDDGLLGQALHESDHVLRHFALLHEEDSL